MNEELKRLEESLAVLDAVNVESLPVLYRRKLEHAKRGFSRTVRVCTRLADAVRAQQARREAQRARLEAKLAQLKAKLEAVT